MRFHLVKIFLMICHLLLYRSLLQFIKNDQLIKSLFQTFAFMAMVPLSYALAFIVYMAYEVPFAGLDRVITASRLKTPKQQ